MKPAMKMMLARSRSGGNNTRSGGGSWDMGPRSDKGWKVEPYRTQDYARDSYDTQDGMYSGGDIGFNNRSSMNGGSYGRSGGNRSEMSGYQTENRQRRDSRGRYAMAGMEDNMARRGGSRPEMNARSGMGGAKSSHTMGESNEYEDEDDEMELDELTAHEWTKAMKNEDGSKGPHWTKEQTKLFMKQVGASEVEPIEFFAVMNAMYSDYCKVAKKYGVDKPEYYAELAKAWLEDKDAVEGKAKMYYKCIVEH